MKSIEQYPAKILLAWGEAISGNKKMLDFLMTNGFRELGVFCYALQNDGKARKWLADNKYFELLALVNGSEGNEEALEWLAKNKLHIMYHVACAADSNYDIRIREKSKKWLENKERFFLLLSMKIQKVKDRIEWDNDDPHKIHFN